MCERVIKAAAAATLAPRVTSQHSDDKSKDDDDNVSQQQHTGDDADVEADAGAADARRQVFDHLVDEFLELVVNVDRRSAQQYLIKHQMNLDAALNAFFDDDWTSS